MCEDLHCKNFQNLAAELVERWQSQQTACTGSELKYIMFDQREGTKGRMFLRPTRFSDDLATSSSTPLPDSPDSSLEHLKDTLLRNSSRGECDPRGVGSANVAEQKTTNQILTASLPGELTSSFHEEESNQAGGGYLYDDADDLEALLGCSDEESISRNAPSSELTCHFGLPHQEAGYCEPSSRKRGCELDEEVESRFNSKRQRSQDELDDEVDDICNGTTCSSSVSVVDAYSRDSLGHPSELEYGDEEDCGEELDESALELQMLCEDSGFNEEQQCSSCSKEADGEENDSVSSGSARKSRQDKIKKTVKLLRNIIPGGDCMDTAIVLDEAIHYVKLLQLQVQTLEAKRLVERRR